MTNKQITTDELALF